MSDTRLAKIIGELQGEEGKLRKELAEVEVKRKGIAGELKQISDALAALGVGGGKKRGKATKPAANREQVVAAVVDILGEKEVCHAEVLYGDVSAVISERGMSKVGLKLRLQEALKDDRFVESKEGWGLKKGATKTA